MSEHATGAPRLLLDTHVWIWLALGVPGRFRPPVLQVIDVAGREKRLCVSIMSVWEVALLNAKGRLHLPVPVPRWIELALSMPQITLLPLADPAVMVDACHLPGDFHPDPADRILVATARAENATLVTRDEKILAYAQAGHVRVLAV
jgi:PIN domain nuclease of toxin-antitoxin system